MTVGRMEAVISHCYGSLLINPSSLHSLTQSFVQLAGLFWDRDKGIQAVLRHSWTWSFLHLAVPALPHDLQLVSGFPEHLPL